MALEGFDAIAIVAVLVIIFLWGPQKVPDIARAIGQAKREFDKASTGISTAIQQPVTMTAPASPAFTLTAPAHVDIDPVIVAAKSLGISTEGKTKEELAKEILGSAK